LYSAILFTNSGSRKKQKKNNEHFFKETSKINSNRRDNFNRFGSYFRAFRLKQSKLTSCNARQVVDNSGLFGGCVVLFVFRKLKKESKIKQKAKRQKI